MLSRKAIDKIKLFKNVSNTGLNILKLTESEMLHNYQLTKPQIENYFKDFQSLQESDYVKWEEQVNYYKGREKKFNDKVQVPKIPALKQSEFDCEPRLNSNLWFEDLNGALKGKNDRFRRHIIEDLNKSNIEDLIPINKLINDLITSQSIKLIKYSNGFQFNPSELHSNTIKAARSTILTNGLIVNKNNSASDDNTKIRKKIIDCIYELEKFQKTPLSENLIGIHHILVKKEKKCGLNWIETLFQIMYHLKTKPNSWIWNYVENNKDKLTLSTKSINLLIPLNKFESLKLIKDNGLVPTFETYQQLLLASRNNNELLSLVNFLFSYRNSNVIITRPILNTILDVSIKFKETEIVNEIFKFMVNCWQRQPIQNEINNGTIEIIDEITHRESIGGLKVNVGIDELTCKKMYRYYKQRKDGEGMNYVVDILEKIIKSVE